MGFVGKVWKVLVGVKDGLVLIFMLLFFITLFGFLSAAPSPAQVREGALVIDLSGFVVEESSAIDPLSTLLSGEAPEVEHQARDVVRALDAAAKDDRIKAVVMDLTKFVGGGQVHMQDIAEAMDRVRKAEKPVLTFALGYGDDHMHLASHASEVWLDPMGGALVTGPGGSILYYGALLDRLNINAKVYRVGEFKSAVEPYLRNSMSPEARENLEGLYAALWEEWQANVKKARPDADFDSVITDPMTYAQASQGDLAQAALGAGLVDKLGSYAEFGARVAEIAGEDSFDDTPGAFAKTELAAFLADNPTSTNGKAIAVATVSGEIVDGEAGPGIAGGTRIATLLDNALSDEPAGLVVRVNSPGGSVFASEEIRRAILRYRDKDIPVAVSFANIAASGGYWVATAGDRIFAEPETITGSIGVFAVLPSFENAANSIGVNADGLRTTPLSGQPDIIGGFSPEVDAILQASVEDTYSDFLERVSDARAMPTDQVDTIAQGRVWDGGTARQLKLVDQFGGLDEALAWVAGKAGLEDDGWHARFLTKPLDGTQALLRQFLTNSDTGQVAMAPRPRPTDLFALSAQRRDALLSRIMADADRLSGRAGIQAYCLECPQSARPKSVQMQALGSARSLKALRALLAE